MRWFLRRLNRSPPPILSVTSEAAAVKTSRQANTLVSTGESLLGFIVTEQADGTIVADHESHASHASHDFARFRHVMGGATDLVVEFGAGVQSLGALQAAAYRLIGTATCQIDRVSDRFVCRLTPVSIQLRKQPSDLEALKAHFLDLVTDENLRERIATRTEGVRNVILSLAFGSLASLAQRPFLTVTVGATMARFQPAESFHSADGTLQLLPLRFERTGNQLSRFKHGRRLCPSFRRRNESFG